MGKFCRHPECPPDHCLVRPKKQKGQKRIKPFSDKRVRLNAEYSRLTRPLWQMKKCEVGSPVCTKWAQGMHHKKGKIGKLLIDLDFMEPCCNACNTYIESHSAWAIATGHKLSKH